MKPYIFFKVVFWTLCEPFNVPSRKPYFVIYTRADVAEWLRRSAAIRSTRNQLSTLLFQSQHWDIQHTSIVNTNDTRLLLNTQRVREFEPRRLRLFFVCCFFFFIIVFASSNQSVWRDSLGAFGKKNIIFRIKTSSSLFISLSLSLSLRRRLRLREREREREREEKRTI